MELSHVDKNGACMVDVSNKDITARIAIAHGKVSMDKETIKLLVDQKTPKGDVLNTARVAGIMAAKNTSSLIPMCHPIALSHVEILFDVKEDSIEITASSKTSSQTGVEMEALTAVSVAALTIYDMLKAVDKRMVIGDIYLQEKDGGKSGHFVRG